MALRTTAWRSQAADSDTAVPQARAVSRRSSLILVAALLAYTGLAVTYAVGTPIWQAPDEPAHFNYVRQVAETGTLPELREGDWDSDLLSRVQNGALEGIDRIRYESWQPPLAYVVAAPVYLLGPRDPASAVLRLRLWGALLGGLTIVIGYAAARTVLGDTLALAVPFVMAGVPMFTAISASVSVDPVANLLAALLLLAVLRQAQAGWTGALLGLGFIT